MHVVLCCVCIVLSYVVLCYQKRVEARVLEYDWQALAWRSCRGLSQRVETLFAFLSLEDTTRILRLTAVLHLRPTSQVWYEPLAVTTVPSPNGETQPLFRVGFENNITEELPNRAMAPLIEHSRNR